MSEQENKPVPYLGMRSQYIKDLSFENPHAPASLMALKEAPKVDLNVDMGAQRLSEDMFELSMQFNIRAMGERTLFLVDMVYAGIFTITGIPEDKLEQILLVDCAFLLFPYARRVISDVTRDGGYPPLHLEPIDFLRMYAQKRQEAAAAGNVA